jgi:hypothetical protein
MMAVKKDWFPTRRKEQLTMAKNWGNILPAKRKDWNIPEAEISELVVLTGAADTALRVVEHAATHTPIATDQCRAAFRKLKDKMRDIKRRYFFIPPLTKADLVSLGLRLSPKKHTPLAAPTAEVTARTYLVERYELGLQFVYVTGNPNDRANKGFRVWYQVVAPGEAAPTNPDHLHESFFTKRKKDVLKFACEDSGKTAYFSVQVENGSKQGKRGPLGSALIP